MSYVSLNASIIKKHLSPFVKGLRFNEVSVNRSENIVMKLNQRGVNPRTINCLIRVVSVPIRDYCRKNRIPDPFQNLQKVKESSDPVHLGAMFHPRRQNDGEERAHPLIVQLRISRGRTARHECEGLWIYDKHTMR